MPLLPLCFHKKKIYASKGIHYKNVLDFNTWSDLATSHEDFIEIKKQSRRLCDCLNLHPAVTHPLNTANVTFKLLLLFVTCLTWTCLHSHCFFFLGWGSLRWAQNISYSDYQKLVIHTMFETLCHSSSCVPIFSFFHIYFIFFIYFFNNSRQVSCSRVFALSVFFCFIGL